MNSIIILLVIIGIVAGLILLLISKRLQQQQPGDKPQPAKAVPAAHNPARAAVRPASNTPATPLITDKQPPQDAQHLPQAGRLAKLKTNTLFWGVEFGQPGCAASHALLGIQFTFEKAPNLPIANCDSAMCTCQFKGLKNRRCKHRRRYQDRRNEVRFDMQKPERRSRKDRRSGNQWNDRTY